MSRGESGRSSSHRCPALAAVILSFLLRLFTFSFSCFDTFDPGGGQQRGVGASSLAEPSDSPFVSSPSSSLGVSARFIPAAVLPLVIATVQGGKEAGAEGGCPIEEPE